MVKRGAFRVVLCIGKYAIKFPRITQLCKGIRCNRWEVEVWKVWRKRFKSDHLCPVLISIPSSLVVVMRRAELTATSKEIRQASETVYDYYPNLNIEYKPENWGKIDGKLVCLDYGLEEVSDISNLREYLQSNA